MTLTTEQQNLLTAMIIELEDYKQAIVEEMLLPNQGRIGLSGGETEITFDKAYEDSDDWELVFAKATDSEGYDIGYTITARTVSSFTVEVNDACTFYYKAERFPIKTWITD